jgi:hypothetical protein
MVGWKPAMRISPTHHLPFILTTPEGQSSFAGKWLSRDSQELLLSYTSSRHG